MPAKQLKNYFVNPKTKMDFSRSAFNYKRSHTFNALTGLIYPVCIIPMMPGDSAPNKFGFVLQSANLLGPSVDDVYVDVVSVWCPTRLVLGNFNEWLGDNDQFAWTLGNDIHYPKIYDIYTGLLNDPTRTVLSKSYVSEHYLGPHIGFRFYRTYVAPQGTNFNSSYGNTTRVHNGISVIPSRQYDLIYNELWRNENIQNPILFSKQSGDNLALDIQNYTQCLGKLHRANRLKDVFNMARLGPSIQTVDIGLGNDLPVITGQSHLDSNLPSLLFGQVGTAGTLTSSYLIAVEGGSGKADIDTSGTPTLGGANLYPSNLWADLSALTVNNLYYSIMMQRYLNKASAGRRPVEFYKLFFGISSSDAVYDVPELLSQKRYRVNISRVVATSNSTNSDTSKAQGLGTQGAFSVTSVGGQLFPQFTSTEYGFLWVFAVIRTQESYASGIDRYLTDHDLLSTYIPTFDHIGEDYIELSEISNMPLTNSDKVFGYQEAWYNYRYAGVNDVVGIVSPTETLSYWTLARNFDENIAPFTVNDTFISQGPLEVDRMLQLPVCYGTPSATGYDELGEPYNSDRYQWIMQFVVAGDFVRTMSKDSEPLLFGSRI